DRASRHIHRGRAFRRSSGARIEFCRKTPGGLFGEVRPRTRGHHGSHTRRFEPAGGGGTASAKIGIGRCRRSRRNSRKVGWLDRKDAALRNRFAMDDDRDESPRVACAGSGGGRGNGGGWGNRKRAAVRAELALDGITEDEAGLKYVEQAVGDPNQRAWALWMLGALGNRGIDP